MVVFSTCTDFIRTVPALQHDASRPEDLDTSAEDHAADEARYGLMSRPYVRKATEEKKNPVIEIGGSSSMTMNDLLKSVKKKQRYD